MFTTCRYLASVVQSNTALTAALRAERSSERARCPAAFTLHGTPPVGLAAPHVAEEEQPDVVATTHALALADRAAVAASTAALLPGSTALEAVRAELRACRLAQGAAVAARAADVDQWRSEVQSLTNALSLARSQRCVTFSCPFPEAVKRAAALNVMGVCRDAAMQRADESAHQRLLVQHFAKQLTQRLTAQETEVRAAQAALGYKRSFTSHGTQTLASESAAHDSSVTALWRHGMAAVHTHRGAGATPLATDAGCGSARPSDASFDWGWGSEADGDNNAPQSVKGVAEEETKTSVLAQADCTSEAGPQPADASVASATRASAIGQQTSEGALAALSAGLLLACSDVSEAVEPPVHERLASTDAAAALTPEQEAQQEDATAAVEHSPPTATAPDGSVDAEPTLSLEPAAVCDSRASLRASQEGTANSRTELEHGQAVPEARGVSTPEASAHGGATLRVARALRQHSDDGDGGADVDRSRRQEAALRQLVTALHGLPRAMLLALPRAVLALLAAEVCLASVPVSAIRARHQSLAGEMHRTANAFTDAGVTRPSSCKATERFVNRLHLSAVRAGCGHGAG